uniref:Uncharacterized protein n=1 Tax=Rhizophora mucronata TaxID=61149 RepID=A0A2P2PUS6_RHIMU
MCLGSKQLEGEIKELLS